MPIALTDENYHSAETNREYMSYSQYKDFLTCEAMAMAKIFRGWEEPKSPVFLMGSYVHAWNEERLEQFREEHPEFFTRKGELYAQYRFAEEMIRALESDAFCLQVLQGRKEVILAAEFAGCMWKGRMDVYYPERGYFADIKTTRSIHERIWSKESGRFDNFIEAYGHAGQLAVYAELEKRMTHRDRWLEPLLVAVSKEDPPDKAVIAFDDDRIGQELDRISFQMERVLAVKTFQTEPVRCEKCRYCRETKKVTRAVHYSEIG